MRLSYMHLATLCSQETFTVLGTQYKTDLAEDNVLVCRPPPGSCASALWHIVQNQQKLGGTWVHSYSELQVTDLFFIFGLTYRLLP